MAADFDWAQLANVVEPKREAQRLSWPEVKGNFRKVAWDVYKPLDGSESLWELREDTDGQKYLYAMYEAAAPVVASEEPQLVAVAQSSDWTAVCDRDRKNITLSFKGFPLKRFGSEEFKFAPDEAEQFARFLQDKTADAGFVRQIIKGLPLSTAGILSELKTNNEE